MADDTQKLVEVDGKKISQEELEKLQQDPSVKVKPLQEGVFKTLKKMFG